MPQFNINVSRTAFAMLDKHVKFLAQVNGKAADKLRKDVISRIRSLDENPKKFPLWLPHFDLPKPFRRIIISKRYIVLFVIEGNKVHVAYVLDSRMNNDELFE